MMASFGRTRTRCFEKKSKEMEESSAQDMNGNEEGLQNIPRPRAKSQRKIIPTKKAEKICDYCERNFGNARRQDHENHVMKCKMFHPFTSGENSTRCGLCPDAKEYATQGNLFLHLERQHKDQIIPTKNVEKKCEFCEVTILQSHWTVHVKACRKYSGLIKQLQCVPCTKDYDSRRALLNHINQSHANLINMDGGDKVLTEPKAKISKKRSKMSENGYLAEPKAKILKDASNLMEENGDVAEPKAKISKDALDLMKEIGDVVEPEAKISNDTSNLMSENGDVAEPKPKISKDSSNLMEENGDLAEPKAKISKDVSNLINENADVAEPKVGIPKNTPLEKLECTNCQAQFEDSEQWFDHFKTCDPIPDHFKIYDPTPDEDPSMEEALVAKQCQYCGDLVLRENISKHLERCSQAADLVKGIKCIRCPQKQFKVKRDVYLHVLEIHVPEDEVDNQLDTTEEMEEGVEEEIPRNETEPKPGKRIYDVGGNPNPGDAATNLVVNDFFSEVDPRVVTKLFICPLCFCKLASRKIAENHVLVHHKIDAATFQNVNLNFDIMEV